MGSLNKTKIYMKKLLYLLSISFLMLQSCSSSDSDNNTNTTSISDVDGNVYQTVTICNQTWTKSNLNVSKYRNGDEILQATTPSELNGLSTGAWCYYQNNTANGTIYGKLYNWYAVNDPRGLAPQGWHIPSDAEWTSLINCLGGEYEAGRALKKTGVSHWEDPNDATNSSGFTALPGGFNQNGTFNYEGSYGIWWSSSIDNNSFSKSWVRFIMATSPMCVRMNYSRTFYHSVRCVKD